MATVVDGFAETDQWARFNGKPGVLIQVYEVGDQSAIEVSDAVHNYVAEAQPRMPEGITLVTWMDQAKFLRDRMDLLLRNAFYGLIFLFIILVLFLKIRLALWVAVGIPVSFLGALAMMPMLDISINMLSLFAFIVVLGIVVDDAIVVGESIYTRHQAGEPYLKGAVRGAHQVMVPVIFAVLTSVAAFTPLMFVPGFSGKFWRIIPLIVIPVLLFSLLESLLILPAHLSHFNLAVENPRKSWLVARWDRFQNFFSGGLESFARNTYRRSLDIALRWRYLTLSIAISTLLIVAGIVGAGWVKLVFMP